MRAFRIAGKEKALRRSLESEKTSLKNKKEKQLSFEIKY